MPRPRGIHVSGSSPVFGLGVNLTFRIIKIDAIHGFVGRTRQPSIASVVVAIIRFAAPALCPSGAARRRAAAPPRPSARTGAAVVAEASNFRTGRGFARKLPQRPAARVEATALEYVDQASAARKFVFQASAAACGVHVRSNFTMIARRRRLRGDGNNNVEDGEENQSTRHK